MKNKKKKTSFFTIRISIEKWKFNKLYNLYISNNGNVRKHNLKKIDIKFSNNGYCYVYTNHGWKSVHRIVALAWKPIENHNEMTIDHIDMNKRNNAIKNLEWVTHDENLKRAEKATITKEEHKNGKIKKRKTALHGSLNKNGIVRL